MMWLNTIRSVEMIAASILAWQVGMRSTEAMVSKARSVKREVWVWARKGGMLMV